MTGQRSGVILTLTAVPGRMPAQPDRREWTGLGRRRGRARVPWHSRWDQPASGWSACAPTRSRRHRSSRRTTPRRAAVVGLTPAEFRERLEQSTLLKRLPTLAEVADTAAFLASDRAGAMTATVANLSAGSITD